MDKMWRQCTVDTVDIKYTYHKVVAWSGKAKLTPSTSKCETAFFNLDCTEAAWQPNITIDGKRMFFNPFPVFLGVRYGRQLTSSVPWEAQPGDDTLWTVVRSTLRLCVPCLNMQQQPGHIGCQLPPPANLRKFSWRRPEPSPALSTLPQLKQSSRNPCCPLYQRVSKPSPSKKLTSGPIFHQRTIVVKSSSPHAYSA